MGNIWFKKVASAVPRGFSRQFILNLLRESPHTGKEIIDYATKHSKGVWKPSPGLIYPLLGRLLDEGLVDEAENGKYTITKKGTEMAEDIDKIRENINKQIDVLARLGNVGKFVTADIIDKIIIMGLAISSNASYMKEENIQKYRQFLQDELKKIDQIEKDGGDKGKKDANKRDGDDDDDDSDSADKKSANKQKQIKVE